MSDGRNKESSGSLRINKYLAHCGVCSRRDADGLIAQGKVLVNGRQAVSGQQVTAEDEILVGGKSVRAPGRLVVLAFYKPIGVTCTERDVHAEKKVMDIIKYPERVTYAGRLDKDSEGLLLLSNNGDLLQAMMKGANRHEKEYFVRVSKEITDDFLTKMSEGVFLRELGLKTRECELEKIGKYTFRIVLTQGVNRQIRRMCAECGYRVDALKRVRVMSVELGSLHPGEYRELSTEEIGLLCRECGLQQENL